VICCKIDDHHHVNGLDVSTLTHAGVNVRALVAMRDTAVIREACLGLKNLGYYMTHGAEAAEHLYIARATPA